MTVFPFFFFEVYRRLMSNLFIHLQLPHDFTFAQTIDLFFKIHDIFEIKFDERLQNAIFFLKHYTYKMKQGKMKPTTKMIELYNHLESIN